MGELGDIEAHPRVGWTRAESGLTSIQEREYHESMKQTIAFPQYDAVCDAFRHYGVSYAGLFGSRAFGDNRTESDYDIVVEFSPESTTTLLGMIELRLYLEDLLGSNVDLVTKQSISPYLRDSILSSVIPLYG